MTRKWIALLLALCMALGLLAGCARADVADLAQTAAEIAAAYDTAQPAQTGAGDELVLLPADTPEPIEPQSATETADAPEDAPESEDAPAALDPDGSYTSKEDVALYLHLYGELPKNFITKNEARGLGWSGGGLDAYAPGCSIGGDRFGNYEGLLPDGSYHECDIDTMHASSRGAKRIVYSDDGYIYYTDDHYESFTLLYPEG